LRTQVKICGLKTGEALEAALEGGADYVGLVFFGKSPRNTTLEEARARAALARGRAKIVALSVDADDATLDGIVEAARPDVLQLHGHESPERVAAIKARYGLTIWKALPVEAAADAERAFEYAGIADLIVFDGKPPKGADLPGGNGRVFDWAVLEAIKGRLPFMLSGGLTAENVGEAVRVTGAQAVDVSSGVESGPGIKDPELIRRFLRAVNGST
jgi:phosphoribosylanthranilate isomerase